MDLSPSTTLLIWAGAAAPLLYAVTVAVGAVLRPSYSHAGNAISELLEADAPHRLPLNMAFLIYNLLVVAFAFAILGAIADAPFTVTLAAWFLGVTGLAGALMWGFPMDPIGRPATATGIGHIILAGICSVGTMGAVLSFAIGAGAMAGWKDFATYSYATFAMILVTGGFAAISAARRWRLMGLLERLTIAIGLQWVAVLAFTLLA